MIYKTIYKNQMTHAVAGGLLLGLSSFGVEANTNSVMGNIGSSGNAFMNAITNSGIRFGGWVHGGATFNPYQTDGFNGPVTFADQANRVQMNQLNFFLERPVRTEGRDWDIGFRADFMFGTDAIFTQAYGNPPFDVNNGRPLADRGNWDLGICCSSLRTYGIAIPQAYAEVYVPVGNGLNIKVGHFYTPIGYESVPAPNNFFYTHAYTMQYGEPFTHTGVLSNYTINKNFTAMAGAIGGSGTGGWDGNFDKQMENWGGIGGVTWTSDDRKTSFNVSGTGSTTSTRNSSFWGMYSIVLKHMLTDKTHLVVQHDHGFADNVLLANLKYGGVVKDAQWYGVNMHLYYDLTPELSIGARGEWFRDRDGFRVFAPGRVGLATNYLGNSYALGGATQLATSTPADYYAVTVGANWKAAKTLNLQWKGLKNLNIRPNFRYDRVDSLHTATYRPFGGNKDQFLFSLDAILPF
ncbi:MAG: porin [Gammaproteobacteria bacterium]|nr:porin [Pseudomonadota bacterium]QOJ21200.1 MAG: porin [Gammaproteobacteria bacterium]